jgi:hypothetical protein
MDTNETYQLTLFNDCATSCEAFAACGGNRCTAPCGCVWPMESEKRYKCNECYIICREREAPFQDEFPYSSAFAKELGYGRTLDQVQLRQPRHVLPISIPSYTTNKYCPNNICSDYAAIDIRMLFNCRRTGKAVLKPKFKTEDELRKYLHVTPTCKLIAVFNGEDWMLESIWAMPRIVVLQQLISLGFTLCTGPTFSVTKLTTGNTPVPYSHHTAMHMRHNKVLSEINTVGLCGVPNLYWLDGDNRELERWTSWLKNNPDIYLVSKDFTSTKKWKSIESKLLELIYLLEKTDRIFHILIIGTGHRNAGKIVKKLTQIGHSVSIITSAPIMKAIHGNRYILNNEGKLLDSKTNHPFSALIKYNLMIFKKWLNSNAA